MTDGLIQTTKEKELFAQQEALIQFARDTVILMDEAIRWMEVAQEREAEIMPPERRLFNYAGTAGALEEKKQHILREIDYYDRANNELRITRNKKFKSSFPHIFGWNHD